MRPPEWPRSKEMDSVSCHGNVSGHRTSHIRPLSTHATISVNCLSFSIKLNKYIANLWRSSSMPRCVYMRQEGTRILVAGWTLVETQNETAHFREDWPLGLRALELDPRSNGGSSSTGCVISGKVFNFSFFICKIEIIVEPTYKVPAKMSWAHSCTHGICHNAWHIGTT